MIENKIIYGFSDIHVCTHDGTPIPIKGAINIDININRPYTDVYTDDGNKRIYGKFKGEGKLKVLGLTEEEQCTLFGYRRAKNGGIVIGAEQSSPNLKLLFSRENHQGNKILYCFYSVKFNPSNLTANTIDLKKGLEEDILEIDFVANEDNEGLLYYTIDTDNSDVINMWFNKVQYPEF